MLLHKYLNRASNIFSLNRVLLVAILGLVIVTAMMIQTVNRQIEARTTVLVPLTSTGVMEIGYDEASPEYLRAMARYIINLAFTYTADSARSQFEELLTFFAPEQREAERRRWLAIADKIKKVKRVSRTFFIDDITKKEGQDTLIVRGTTARRLGDKLELERAVIGIDYRIQYGRFLLLNMRRLDKHANKNRRAQEMVLKEIIRPEKSAATGDDQGLEIPEGSDAN